MLLQFTVSNYLSFDAETTFSMVADRGDLHHPNHVIESPNRKGVTAVRAAAIYGANAAGKSNFVEAIIFAREQILKGTRGSQAISVSPFLFGNGAGDRASSFEFIFRYGGVTYSYGFRANRSRIVEEYLFATKATPRARETRLFERTTAEDDLTKVEFGAGFQSGERKKQFFDFVAEGTRPNQLFLTEAADRNVEAVRPVVDWFQDVLLIIPAESVFDKLELMTHAGGRFTEFINDFLRVSGTGILGIHSEASPSDVDEAFPAMNGEMKAELRHALGGLTGDDNIRVTAPTGQQFLLSRDKTGNVVNLELRTRHQPPQHAPVDLPLGVESDGTQRLIHLLPVLFSLQEEGKVVLIDELDRRLHPLLCRRFVETALQCCGTRQDSQIIFTTHNANLLDLDLLRRDEIWFVEKDKSEASRMYSLSEFKIRPDLKISTGYLNGRFGAIPLLGHVRGMINGEIGRREVDAAKSGVATQE